MNYLEEYKKLKKTYDDEKTNYNRYLSDMTYTIFETFIMDVLPSSIEKTLKVVSLSLVTVKFEIVDKYLDFVGKDGRNYIGTLVCNNKKYGTINILLFNEFMSNIPGRSSDESNGTTHYYHYKIESIIDYYFEQLQEYEYYGISYTKKK